MRQTPSWIRRTATGMCLALGAIACDPGGTVAPPTAGQSAPAFPVAMLVLDGNTQEGTVGAELPTALSVRVVDAGGAPIAGQAVNFRVVAGGGAVYAGTAITTADGRAAERWTLGTVAGEAQRVEARAVHPVTGERIVFATFEATARPGSPATVVRVAPDSQAAPAGTRVAAAPAVRVVDRYGNGISGASIAFRVTSGGGALGVTTATSDAAGAASAQSWTLGTAVGPNVVTATSGTLPAASFLATATQPPSRPTIVLGATAIGFVGVAGGGATTDQTVRVESTGGVLTGVTGTISYASGQPTGWLQGAIGATTPTVATLRANPATLAAGTYTATVRIDAPGASNSPQTIQVAFVVGPAAGGGATNVCALIAGASVIAEDGTFLGTLTNRFDGRSVFNEFGTYGSKFSATSIWNTFGQYGSEFGAKSAFNAFTRTPPILVLNGEALAYLTVNQSLTPRVDPRALFACTFP
jgi:hypothetical protein